MAGQWDPVVARFSVCYHGIECGRVRAGGTPALRLKMANFDSSPGESPSWRTRLDAVVAIYSGRPPGMLRGGPETAGDLEPEFASLAFFALNTNGSAVLFDDGFADGQPKTGAAFFR